MGNQSRKPGRAAHPARSHLADSDQLLERKRRRRTTGLVEILPVGPDHEPEIRNIVGRAEERERERDADAAVRAVTPFQDGLAVETTTEKLAQHIADALARSRKAHVERVFDDEGQRRILTCRLPREE